MEGEGTDGLLGQPGRAGLAPVSSQTRWPKVSLGTVPTEETFHPWIGVFLRQPRDQVFFLGDY